MSSSLGLLAYLGLGLLGGLLGAKLKIPAGVLIGAMLAVICFKIVMKVHLEVPKGLIFVLQVVVGIGVGAAFQPELLQVMKKNCPAGNYFVRGSRGCRRYYGYHIYAHGAA